MRHDVRTLEFGPCLLGFDAAVRQAAHGPRGDKVVLLTPRLNEDGQRMGNREERRRAARILRHRDRQGAPV